MTEQITDALRVSELAAETFLSDYIGKSRPVIVTDAMREWKALSEWTPAYFSTHFGTEKVQVYGDLFRLIGITSLSEYLNAHFGQDKTQDRRSGGFVPYVRWYCHLACDERVPWADDVFRKLKNDWGHPYFFPTDSFVLPYCPSAGRVDSSLNWFPARGLFISGAGARTRLHVDPWCSDALLFQIHGEKDFVMYDPGQAPRLTNGGRVVDVDAPDLQLFPDFPDARSSVRDTLRPGEALVIPAGWFHHFTSATDSISLTWNFVHRCRFPEFLAYMAASPKEAELRQLAYAFFESPGRVSLDGSDLLEVVSDLKRFL